MRALIVDNAISRRALNAGATELEIFILGLLEDVESVLKMLSPIC